MQCHVFSTVNEHMLESTIFHLSVFSKLLSYFDKLPSALAVERERAIPLQ